MPQANRGKQASPKNSRSKTSSSKPPARPGQNAAKPPRRREVMAAVCFILAVFSFIGYWNSDGAFIGFFIGLVKGLVGQGFFALPPALLLCSIILTFHRGRPVRYRVTCTLILTVITGALTHLFACKLAYVMSFAMLKDLWNDGKSMLAGGVVSGTLTELFLWLFGKIGAAVVLICATLFLLLSAFNRTIAGIVDAVKRRERRQYFPEPEPVTPPSHPLPPLPPPQNRPPRRSTLTALKRRKAIDIPLDEDAPAPVEDYFPVKQKEHLFKSTPRVKTPDQLIAEYSPDEVGGDSDDEEEIVDVPLDIPFMEPKRSYGAKGGPSAGGAAHAQMEKHPAGSNGAAETGSSATTAASDATATSDATAANTASANDASATTAPDASSPRDPNAGSESAAYVFPPLELLSKGEQKATTGVEEVRVISERLEAAFHSFNVNVKISNTTRGPSVTRYEAELEAGIKLSKLTSLADDIALSLGTSGVRIAAMPNKISTVGIEVPNKTISTVNLRDIIESAAFSRAKSKLTFAIGMDISGEAIVGNISKLPHMLVAGTTGSGKSVCLNSLILSILYKATPDDVRFIMIDPKMVEFRVYNDIPHLLVPVVTDVKKASGALQWAVFEMMKRYTLFSETTAREIDGYNQIAAKTEDRNTLPHIIVVIDELADLMLMAAKEVEESVCRVAQMGRAAGMHLVISTQSPRADVITGLMKANIPTRIALKVSSALESRIILDAGGNADKLVGNGDMLYAPIGTTKPMRLQGTWVSDKEREIVVGYIKKGGDSQYSEEVIHEIEKAAIDKSSPEKPKDEPESSDYDELLPQAVDVIFETGQASVSMLQRRLKLGYSRAARIVDQMEQMGVVGPFEGSKPRAVLVTKDQWRQMQYVSGVAPTDKTFQDSGAPVYEPDESDD